MQMYLCPVKVSASVYPQVELLLCHLRMLRDCCSPRLMHLTNRNLVKWEFPSGRGLPDLSLSLSALANICIFRCSFGIDFDDSPHHPTWVTSPFQMRDRTVEDEILAAFYWPKSPSATGDYICLHIYLVNVVIAILWHPCSLFLPSVPFPPRSCRTCPPDMASDFRFPLQRAGNGVRRTREGDWQPVYVTGMACPSKRKFSLYFRFASNFQSLSMALKAYLMGLSLQI